MDPEVYNVISEVRDALKKENVSERQVIRAIAQLDTVLTMCSTEVDRDGLGQVPPIQAPRPDRKKRSWFDRIWN
jgi:hypothetical protein